jgi:hypothetical protein
MALAGFLTAEELKPIELEAKETGYRIRKELGT